MNAPMFYCGCLAEPGHYLWRENQHKVSWKETDTIQPWGHWIDGGLTPLQEGRAAVANGVARLMHAHGWTSLSWWDNSIDSRPGSHSTFVVAGTWSAEEMCSMARARFPWVFERFKYEVVLPTQKEPA